MAALVIARRPPVLKSGGRESVAGAFGTVQSCDNSFGARIRFPRTPEIQTIALEPLPKVVMHRGPLHVLSLADKDWVYQFSCRSEMGEVFAFDAILSTQKEKLLADTGGKVVSEVDLAAENQAPVRHLVIELRDGRIRLQRNLVTANRLVESSGSLAATYMVTLYGISLELPAAHVSAPNVQAYFDSFEFCATPCDAASQTWKPPMLAK